MPETIAAIFTPGEGIAAILRISGDASLEIMRKLMSGCPEEIEPGRGYDGKLSAAGQDPASEAAGEAVFLYLKAPASYTGEDMLEIQKQGSNDALEEILRAVLGLGIEGVREAEPGEFTKRAFLNGKIDLTQAEAVTDIREAGTEMSLAIAESQIEGHLGDTIREIRSTLLDILAEMAVDIDYPESEIYEGYEYPESFNEDSVSDIVNRLRWVHSDVADLIDTARIGRIARDGVRAVIAGKSNSGKSSLMKALLGEGQVPVTDSLDPAGDTVEETTSMGGVPIVLVDTAGLRNIDDETEKLGIERTILALARADIVILVIDGSVKLDEEDRKILRFMENMNTDHLIAVINKEDLGRTITEDDVRSILPGATVINTSLVGSAADDAARRISEIIGGILDLGSIDIKETSIITNERQLKMLRNADMNLDEAISMLQTGEPMEAAELSAHYAYNALGTILGEEVGDEVLDRVFGKFSLGM